MEIYLIRHTAPLVEEGICYGQTDLEVAPSFEFEVKEILSKYNFIKENFIVYSSPLIRCKKLAERLFGANIYYEDRLMELNFGKWEGRKWDDIERVELDLWMSDFVNLPCPDGESFVDLSTRVDSFINTLDYRKNTKIAVVTHSGVIRAFLARLNDLKLADSFKYEINFGDIFVLKGKKVTKLSKTV